MSQNNDIAIIGIGVRFPGHSNDVDGFWQNLVSGKDCITEIPKERWSTSAHYYPEKGRKGKSATMWAGLIDDVAGFDTDLFDISPREAETMDPQQRMLLEVSWQAMENAGIRPSTLKGTATGVFVGGFTLDYMLMQLGCDDFGHIQPHSATGSMMTLLSNRLSYVYGFNGPSMSVDTACSSSLVATHLAVNSLLNTETDVALVGGVNALLAPGYFIAESQAGMLSPTGRSRAYDSNADGYVRGEGCGVVVLKRMTDAVANGDRIYAAILGTAVNQDGASDGITVPSGDAQQALIKRAYRVAGLEPKDAVFVEAHGTGTPVGDPIEANAVGHVMRENRNDTCFISSVKTNIGHTEAAAGIAGLIKTALCLYNRTLPPHLHLREVNANIDLDELKLKIPTDITPLDQVTDKLVASVNSFGFGGTNAHAVLRAVKRANDKPSMKTNASNSHCCLPISAATQKSLSIMANDYAMSLAKAGGDVSGYLKFVSARREHHDYRAVVFGTDKTHLVSHLKQFSSDGESMYAVCTGVKTMTEGARKLVWVFTGMGPQWWGMGQELYAKESLFKTSMDRVCDRFEKIAGWSLRDEMLKGEKYSLIAETRVSQAANFAIQVALADMWKAYGIVPDAIVGHSAGEAAAAYVSGALSFDDAVDVIYHRSRLQQKTSDMGCMMAVGLSKDDATKLIAEINEELLSIAAVNSETAVTLSGDNDCIGQVQAKLEGTDVFYKKLRVNVPYHSHYMEPLKAEFLDSVKHIRPVPASIPLYSTVYGKKIEGSELNNTYWYLNVREPVVFHETTQALLMDGLNIFLEIGPHPVLATSIKETMEAGKTTGYCCFSLKRNQPEVETLQSMLAQLYCYGYAVNWDAVHGEVEQQQQFHALPAYPWDHRRCWYESPVNQNYRTSGNIRPFLARRVAASIPTWDVNLEYGSLSFLNDHQIQSVVVFPGAGYVEMAMEAATELFGSAHAFDFSDIQFRAALFIDPSRPICMRIVFDKDHGEFTISSRSINDKIDVWTIHASGRVTVRRAISVMHESEDSIKSRCSRVVPQQVCYDYFRRVGLEYGETFRGLNTLWQGDNEAYGKVIIPEKLLGSLGDYNIHPAILDLCFQTLAAALPFPNENDASKVFMPVRVENGRVMGVVLSEVVYIHARVTNIDQQGLSGDIWLLDESGRVIIEITNCLARALSDGNQHVKPQKLYSTQWQPQTLTVATTERLTGVYVLFSNGDAFETDVKSSLSQRGLSPICVHSGDVYQHRGDQFIVNPDKPEDFVRLFTDIASQWQETISGILYLWPVRCTIDCETTEADIETLNNLVVVGLLHAIQAIETIEWQKQPRFWTVTQHAQQVQDDGGKLNVIQAPLWGLGKVSAQIEYKDAWGAMLDLDLADTAIAARQLLTEMTSNNGEEQVAYRGGQRFVPRLISIDEQQLSMPPSFSSDGSYLITGGLGSLGLLTARWMTDRGARHFILLGRTPLPPRNQWSTLTDEHCAYNKVKEIIALERAGAHVTVKSSDINVFSELEQLISDYEGDARPPIKGVIHAAGTAVPKLILNMSADDLRDIMRPKITGAWNLHRAFQNRELDLFVCFSSIASVVVSTGQANYAAGNSFLDVLAELRRAQGIGGLSINWGPWGEAGMATQLDLIKYFEDRGFSPMTNVQGLERFGCLLGDQCSRATVVAADWVKVGERNFPLGIAPAMLTDLIAAEKEFQQSADNGAQEQDSDFVGQLATITDAAERYAAVSVQVRKLVSRVLRTNLNDITVDKSLNVLGLDSMMAIELKAYIERSMMLVVAIVDLLKATPLSELIDKLSEELEPCETDGVDDEEVAELAEQLGSLDDVALSELLAD